MSRSFKHTAISGNSDTHKSEKKDKQLAHKSLRAHFRTQLSAATDLEEFQFDEHSYAHSEVNTFAKGGKHRDDLNVAVEQDSGHIHVKDVTSETKDSRVVHKKLAK